MPTSYPDGKLQASSHLMQALRVDDPILDVGPGCGVWAELLRSIFTRIDALEIFAPYIETYGLRMKYRHVMVGDVRTFAAFTDYRAVILGDVLEHLSVTDAQAVLARIKSAKALALISVPWTYAQGSWGGNDAEAHLQDDLTPSIMEARYPGLRSIFNGGRIGVYCQDP